MKDPPKTAQNTPGPQEPAKAADRGSLHGSSSARADPHKRGLTRPLVEVAQELDSLADQLDVNDSTDFTEGVGRSLAGAAKELLERDEILDDRPRVSDVFTDVRVSVGETATRRYVSMELRSGLQRFHCDVQPSQRGFKQCKTVARALGLVLEVTPDAMQWMQSDGARPNEAIAASNPSKPFNRDWLLHGVKRLRALARRGPSELAMLDSVANELMQQSFALEERSGHAA